MLNQTIGKQNVDLQYDGKQYTPNPFPHFPLDEKKIYDKAVKYHQKSTGKTITQKNDMQRLKNHIRIHLNTVKTKK